MTPLAPHSSSFPAEHYCHLPTFFRLFELNHPPTRLGATVVVEAGNAIVRDTDVAESRDSP